MWQCKPNFEPSGRLAAFFIIRTVFPSSVLKQTTAHVPLPLGQFHWHVEPVTVSNTGQTG